MLVLANNINIYFYFIGLFNFDFYFWNIIRLFSYSRKF